MSLVNHESLKALNSTGQCSSPVSNNLEILSFLSHHMPEFDDEIKELLIEVDKIIEKKKNQWKHELKNLENELSLKISENINLQKLITEKEQDVENALKKLNVLEVKHNECTHQNDLDILKMKFDMISNEYSNLEKKYKDQLESQKNSFLKQINVLEKENNALNLNCEKLKSTKGNSDLHSLRFKLMKERSNADLLKTRYDELQLDKNKTIQSLKHNHHLRVTDLENSLQNCKHTIKRQSVEIGSLKQTLSTKENEIKHLLAKLSLLNSKTRESEKSASLARNMYSANTKLQISNPEIDFNAQIGALESRLNQADAIILEKTQRISQLENSCENASTMIIQLLEAKECAVKQNIVLTKELQDFQSKIIKLEKHLSVYEKMNVNASLRTGRVDFSVQTDEPGCMMSKSNNLSSTNVNLVYDPNDFLIDAQTVCDLNKLAANQLSNSPTIFNHLTRESDARQEDEFVSFQVSSNRYNANYPARVDERNFFKQFSDNNLSTGPLDSKELTNSNSSPTSKLQNVSHCQPTNQLRIDESAPSVPSNFASHSNVPHPYLENLVKNCGHSAAYGLDREEDTGVFNLAANFLAIEHQYSLQLEQQIDSHLEKLKLHL